MKSELDGRFIFSDLYRMNQDEFKDFVNVVITKIGLPLVMNNRKEYISLEPEGIDTSQFVQFYILQEFLNSVLCTSDKTLCPVTDFCVANSSKYNARCCLNPQAKINNQEYCQYIDFLKSYGLSNVEIK